MWVFILTFLLPFPIVLSIEKINEITFVICYFRYTNFNYLQIFLAIKYIYILDSKHWRTGLNKDVAMTIPSVQELMKGEEVNERQF